MAAQVRDGALWLTVSSTPRTKGMKSLTGVVATTLKALRLTVVWSVLPEAVAWSALAGGCVLESLFGENGFLCRDDCFDFEERPEVFSGSWLIPNGTPRGGKTLDRVFER